MGKSPMMKKLIGKQNNLPAELKAKIQASPATKKSDPPTEKTVKVDNITYENPYDAYNLKNIPKKSTKGAPVAGGKVYSSVSGLQVSGKGASNNARKRTDKFMKGEAQGSQGANTVSSDKNKDGLPDNFESTVSEKIKNNSKKTKTRTDKIKAYQKSQLKVKTPLEQKRKITKEGKKLAKDFKKEVIKDSKEKKKSNIAVIREAKAMGYEGARADIKDERKRHRDTKKKVRKGYRDAKKLYKSGGNPE